MKTKSLFLFSAVLSLIFLNLFLVSADFSYTCLGEGCGYFYCSSGQRQITQTFGSYDAIESGNLVRHITYQTAVAGIHGWADYANCLVAETIGPAPTPIDNSAPKVVGSINILTTNSTAAIFIDTNKLANLSINYGTTMALGTLVSTTVLSTSPSILISNLAPNTTYFYNLTLCNNVSNCTALGTFNFTTLANSITPFPSLPDLFINNGYLPNGQTCQDDPEVRFHTNINGTITNSHVPVRAILNGAVMNWLVSLPFPTNTGFLDWGIGFGPLAPGAYNITLITDSNNTIAESNKNNNIFEFIFNVTPQSQCTPLDTTPPAKITNFNYTATNSSIFLSWTNPTDLDFNGTIILLNNALIATLNKTTNTYTLSGLNQNTTYNVTIATKDNAGNQNPASFSVSTTLGNEVTPPIIPPVYPPVNPPIVIHHHTTSNRQSPNAILSVTTDETETRVSGGQVIPALVTSKQPVMSFTTIILLLAILSFLLLILILLLIIFKRR